MTAPSIEHDLDRALVDVGQLDHENTALVEQWHEVAQEAEMWKARAESALRPLGESVDAIVRPLRRAHEDRDRALDACAGRIAELGAALKERHDRVAGLIADRKEWIALCQTMTADRDHWRLIAETEIDGRAEALLDIARLTEDRDAWQRAAERERGDWQERVRQRTIADLADKESP
jgi:hypothetical protein